MENTNLGSDNHNQFKTLHQEDQFVWICCYRYLSRNPAIITRLYLVISTGSTAMNQLNSFSKNRVIMVGFSLIYLYKYLWVESRACSSSARGNPRAELRVFSRLDFFVGILQTQPRTSPRARPKRDDAASVWAPRPPRPTSNCPDSSPSAMPRYVSRRHETLSLERHYFYLNNKLTAQNNWIIDIQL